MVLAMMAPRPGRVSKAYFCESLWLPNSKAKEWRPEAQAQISGKKVVPYSCHCLMVEMYSVLASSLEIPLSSECCLRISASQSLDFFVCHSALGTNERMFVEALLVKTPATWMPGLWSPYVACTWSAASLMASWTWQVYTDSITSWTPCR